MASLLLFSRASSRNTTSLSRFLISNLRCKEPTSRPFIFPSCRTFASAPLNSVEAVPELDVAPKVVTNPPDVQPITPSPDPVLDLSEFLAPLPPEVIEAVAETTALTATKIGLTWWLPTGLVFNILDTLSSHFPWWGSITIFTICARILVFPIMVRNQRKVAENSQVAPDIAMMQNKIMRALKTGNLADMSKVMVHHADIQKQQKDVMWSSLLTASVQAPIFISMYQVVRAMANYPVVTLQNGGLFWFENFAVTDPYYVLHLYIGSTLYLIFRTGVEFGNVNASSATHVSQKAILYGMPVITVGLLAWSQASSALLFYWCVNNTISLIQTRTLRQKAVREYFNIPETRKPDPDDLPPKQTLKERIEGIRESFVRDVDIRNSSARAFEEAGMGPPKKTNKVDWSKFSKE